MRATRSVLTRGFLLAMVSTLLASGALAQSQRSSPPDTEDWWSWAAAEEGRDRAGTRAGDEGARPRRRRPPVGRKEEANDMGRRRGERGRESRRDERAPKRRRGERRYERAEESRGPAFCRTGAGHPVFGMEWCYEHGFDRAGYEQRRGDWRYGRRRRRPERRQADWRWERRPDLEDILLGDPRSGPFSRRSGSVMLGDILGRVLDGPLERLLGRLGGRASVEGRWIEPRKGAHVLQLRIGQQPLAELTDYNGDGRVDQTLVATPTGRH